ncbi:MAG: hypothetical protein GEU78_07915 [Actinobacteria bacterium]|nr:hypothetical protein [Actinomycetota bacterium]
MNKIMLVVLIGPETVDKVVGALPEGTPVARAYVDRDESLESREVMELFGRKLGLCIWRYYTTEETSNV